MGDDYSVHIIDSLSIKKNLIYEVALLCSVYETMCL